MLAGEQFCQLLKVSLNNRMVTSVPEKVYYRSTVFTYGSKGGYVCFAFLTDEPFFPNILPVGTLFVYLFHLYFLDVK